MIIQQAVVEIQLAHSPGDIFGGWTGGRVDAVFVAGQDISGPETGKCEAPRCFVLSALNGDGCGCGCACCVGYSGDADDEKN